MLSTSKNVVSQGHNHLLTTGADDPTTPERVIMKVKGHLYQWLAGAYDLEKGHLQRWITCV